MKQRVSLNSFYPSKTRAPGRTNLNWHKKSSIGLM